MRKHVDEAWSNCQAFGIDDRWGSSTTEISNCDDSITLQAYVCFNRCATRAVIDCAAFNDDVELLLPVRDHCQRKDQRQSQKLVQVVFHSWGGIILDLESIVTMRTH